MTILTALQSGFYGRVQNACSLAGVEPGALPIIIVAGDENQGKSSTLERIAGVSVFPRGDGFTTRMPIRLTLRRLVGDNEVPETVLRQLRGKSVRDLIAGNTTVVVEERIQGVVSDCEEFVMKGMEGFLGAFRQQANSRRAEGTSKDEDTSVIDNEMIEIEIKHPGISSEMQLYDLPGIVGAPHATALKTQRITEEFVKLPNTLIVAIVSATNSSIRNSQALGLVSKHDAVSRTVLALTHCDKCETDVMKRRLAGVSSDMADLSFHSICALINRDTYIPGEGFDSTTRKEKKMFSALKPDKETKGKLGLGCLLQQINALINVYVSSVWLEETIASVRAKQQEIYLSIQALGPDPAQLVPEDVVASFLAELKSAALKEPISIRTATDESYAAALGQTPEGADPTVRSMMTCRRAIDQLTIKGLKNRVVASFLSLVENTGLRLARFYNVAEILVKAIDFDPAAFHSDFVMHLKLSGDVMNASRKASAFHVNVPLILMPSDEGFLQSLTSGSNSRLLDETCKGERARLQAAHDNCLVALDLLRHKVIEE